MTVRRGFWFALDGVDCSGKTTQTLLVSEALKLRGEQVLVLPEFSNGPIGSMITRIINTHQYLALDSIGRTRGADTLALLADFVYKIEDLEIGAYLRSGGVVVSDRGLLSLVAYQAVRIARAVGEPVEITSEWLIKLVELTLLRYFKPDLHILLQIPVTLINPRLISRGEAPLDEESQRFMQEVSALVQSMVERQIYRSKIIDVAGLTPKMLTENLVSLIEKSQT